MDKRARRTKTKEKVPTAEQLDYLEKLTALAMARRKSGLCVYCGGVNEHPSPGYLGGVCDECLQKVAMELSRWAGD